MLHNRFFIIMDREAMGLLGGDLTNQKEMVRFDFHGAELTPHEKELLHYLWMEAMKE
jgi:hypothetical protein